MSGLLNFIANNWPEDDVIRSKPGETGQEQLERVGARRSRRLTKAFVAGAIGLGCVAYPVFDAGVHAIESLSRTFSRFGDSPFPHSADEKPVQQAYPVNVQKSEFITPAGLLETTLALVGAGFLIGAGRKVYLAGTDSDKLKSIQQGIEHAEHIYRGPK